MLKAFAPIALVLALALAGCSDDEDGHALDPVTCPDGTVLSADEVEQMSDAMGHDHHAGGFNATALCPVPPSVTLEGIPPSLQAFKTASFRWSLDNGSLHHAHSMITSIRYHTASVPDSELGAATKYPNELIKREHQDLPVAYQGNLSFSKVGTVYLRAYAEIGGEPYWSDEVRLNVTQVPATGTVHMVTKQPGDLLTPVTPNAIEAVIGDGIQLDNQDVKAHSCEMASGPTAVDAVAAEQQAMSNVVLLLVPGTYVFGCDEAVQPSSFTVNVSVD